MILATSNLTSNSNAVLSFVDGKVAGAVPLSDRALQFGDGLFETMLLHDFSCPLWRLHRQRLLESSGRLSISIDAGQLDADIEALMSVLITKPDFRYGSVKILVSRGDSLRGYNASELMPSRCCLMAFAGGKCQQHSQSLGVSAISLARQPLLAGLKHCNRLEQVLARRELPEGLGEAVMLDDKSHVIEGISSNVFFRQGGHWRTPSLNHSGVAGAVRHLVLHRLIPAMNLTVEQGDFFLEDLLAADQLFICSSLRGIQFIDCLKISGQQLSQLNIEGEAVNDVVRRYKMGAEIVSLQRNFVEILDGNNGLFNSGETFF